MAKTETQLLIKGNTVATGEWKETGGLISSPLAYLDTAGGATAAVAVIEASHDKIGVVILGTITLSTGTPSDTFALPETVNFAYVRARIVSAAGGNVIVHAATFDK